MQASNMDLMDRIRSRRALTECEPADMRFRAYSAQLFLEVQDKINAALRRMGKSFQDLRALPFPLGDWGEPAERLEELYRWAEDGALRTADWYLVDRLWKRRGARGLRIAAAGCATVGTALPLLQLTGAVDSVALWGFPALLGAVVCVGFDRVLGLTSGWMRDVATAQAIQRRLDTLRFDWAAESVREVLGPTEGTAAEAAERCLGILRRFCDEVAELVRMETADWMVGFSAGGSAGVSLRTQSAGSWSARGDFAAPPRVVQPGGRPTMPRQRPPEGPRT